MLGSPLLMDPTGRFTVVAGPLSGGTAPQWRQGPSVEAGPLRYMIFQHMEVADSPQVNTH